MRKDKLIIFDLDGTLYQFQGGSFKNSGLEKIVLKNALKYIQDRLQKTLPEAQKILQKIRREYGEDISIALEKEYNCSRKDYFDSVWNIKAKGIIRGSDSVRGIIKKLNKKYELLLISDGAEVWINNALRELDIEKYFKGRILAGDGDKRKSLGNRFNVIPAEYGFSPQDIVVVGDQEETDIIPAKECGFKTVFIGNYSGYNSEFADINLKTIKKVGIAIEEVFSKI